MSEFTFAYYPKPERPRRVPREYFHQPIQKIVREIIKCDCEMPNVSFEIDVNCNSEQRMIVTANGIKGSEFEFTTIPGSTLGRITLDTEGNISAHDYSANRMRSLSSDELSQLSVTLINFHLTDSFCRHSIEKFVLLNRERLAIEHHKRLLAHLQIQEYY